MSESGVGTIAAGVAKAKADLILISGAEGGTGASPSSSIKHAGLPVEIGLAETQQTLVMNNLGKKSAYKPTANSKPVATPSYLPCWGLRNSVLPPITDCFGLCDDAQMSHLNTCPVGVATQNEELRKRFVGKYEYLVNFFTFLAEETREHLAQLGFKTLDRQWDGQICSNANSYPIIRKPKNEFIQNYIHAQRSSG